ncbi:MAG: MFS transporter [Peptococcaceae bacterium]|jgi:putative MFS transporter|nr:MFS transporter [Peptococcaceae bacterium]
MADVNGGNLAPDLSQRAGCAARLERLPICNYHRWIAALLFVGWFVEGIDISGIGFLMPLIIADLKITPQMASYLTSATFLTMFFGSLFSGNLSDKFGRKNSLIVGMITWGVAGFALTFQQSFTGLLLFRFLLGAGLGIQYPAAMAMISEVVPSRSRGKYMSIYQAFIPLAYGFCGLITVLVLPHFGWRGVFFIEAIPAFWFIGIKRYLPESALWLESIGRYEEADKIVDVFEQRAAATGKPIPPVELKTRGPAGKPGKYSELFTKKYALIMIMCVIWYPATLMSDYGLGTWLTTLLMAKGFNVVRSTAFVSLSVLAGIPAILFVTWGVEKLGRKWTLLISAIMAAIFAYLYGASTTMVMLIVMGAGYQFFKYSISMTNNIYTPELFETRLRATGAGFGIACSRLGAMCGPILLAWVMTVAGVQATFFVAAGLALLAGVTVMILGPETKGKVFNE